MVKHPSCLVVTASEHIQQWYPSECYIAIEAPIHEPWDLHSHYHNTIYYWNNIKRMLTSDKQTKLTNLEEANLLT